MKINAPSEYRTPQWGDRVRTSCKNFLIRKGWEIENSPSEDNPQAPVDIVAKREDKNGELVYGFFLITATYKAESFKESSVAREDVESFMLQYCINDPFEPNSSVSINSISINIFSENRALLRVHYNCFDGID